MELDMSHGAIIRPLTTEASISKKWLPVCHI